jgi:hypothetical protein
VLQDDDDKDEIVERKVAPRPKALKSLRKTNYRASLMNIINRRHQFDANQKVIQESLLRKRNSISELSEV